MARSIMIQGTMSNVGKSIICAGLCRIFRQDGYIAAPFKSQNMALNSYITSDGLEIGRAQAMQAEAAGIEPSVLMNPILLKPTTDHGSQVIVNGKVLGNMRAAEYFRRKKELLPTIKTAYEKLAEQADIIVAEGAGSPAEMNLKKDDIVNMGLAELIDAPVLLVGDIDRGGVFAQLIGTVSLLESHEQQRIKGLIVNKFRGDRSLFQDGIKILEEKSRKPVLGFVPYVDCDIDDEDSLSDRLSEKNSDIIDITVIKLPKISNYTDFAPLSGYNGVSVRYVGKAADLGSPDMIILPGSKSTISDMKWLRESGFESLIKQKVSAGTPIFGICGGYQMLGKTISDPENMECGGTIRGLELLDTHTVFCNKKMQRQSSGIITAKSDFFSKLYGKTVSGYEIHMGQTESHEPPLIQFSDGRRDGTYNGCVFGTYLHGIFDNNDISAAIISELFNRRGLNFSDTINYKEYKEIQYDRLADALRKNIDMSKIYSIVGIR